MAKKIAFVTDSTAFLTEELRAHPDVYVVPIIIISEGREYEDGVDLSSDQLYDMIRNNKDVPKTSQPSVGSFEALYEQLKKDYDHAIAIHVSNKLSGTVTSSAAGKDHVDFSVEVIDSFSLSYAITTLIYKGMALAEQDVDIKEIANELRAVATRSKNLILLGNLEQLYKGGRMSGVQFLLGNVLQIKPILTINSDGELGLLERIRSEKKATNKIVDLLKQSYKENNIKQVGIMHGNVPEKAMALKQKVEEVTPSIDIVIGEISSSLAVHAGEGSLALFWQIEK
ncbi:DegV family protein [Aquibacillus sp. 3ASR75-11]|uniref:DegV family protein n=1 Tax=Terrihalobacillus insolitus TaxID=2950438 RepID=A0A9X4ANV0_9BACI|nr:DegV family protein [Terrihalobacillus insolitus]MDC3413525.1 DegV family protein [Terrihalobacillus insolitus]MDC3426189.1 DegV family protein [Terrihalobacillus insolitus]